MNRQKALLALLLVLLVGASVTSYLRMPQQKSVATLKYTTGAIATPKKANNALPAPEEIRLRLDLLGQNNARFTGYKRNIFKPIFHEEQKALPLPLPPPPPKRQAPPITTPKAVPAVAPQIAEPTPVQRDMAAFTFLGFLKKGDKKTIFLSSNKEIFLAHKGDRLAGKYDVSTITDEALVITSPDGAEIIIPLVENKPLAAPGQSRGTVGR
ncbi:hypothetical protein KI809_00570 [Geobacter pelophilus]|uniref:Type II secretion system protein PulP n=1 Tax=Geoanaerobacter pelophilus TaxID=60036 RepID=A0AAW4L415_9BACT|nr:hypothetical protein [Geoanaerobacter pelophilus]MBT0662784.1 hypothetical protein [Geoanaerobacter pelophilus]